MFPVRIARRILAAALIPAAGIAQAQVEQAAQVPGATTLAASNITTTSARLNGSVTPNGARTTVSFDFGATTSYGTAVSATPSPIARDAGATSVSGTASGLACGTAYHYRVRATSRKGTSLGANQTFNTAACMPAPTPVAPTASTGAASGVTTTGATLNGSATAGSATATLSFDYGTTTAYGSSVAGTPSSLAANASGSMSAALPGLACGTTYHFRARAVSSVAAAVGANQSFATAACAPPPPTACSSTTVHCVSAAAGPNQEFATIQAAVNVAIAGDTVLVFDGNYAGFVVSRSGTSTAPITVKANASAATITSPSSAGEGIRVSNSSYVVIEGFRVTGIGGMGLAARGASVTAPMRGVVFRDNVVSNSGNNNIYASQVVGSLIEGNVASGSASNNGIYIANAASQDTTVRGNLVYGNFANGIHMNGDISVGGDGIQTGLVIEDNVVHSNGENGINMDGVQASIIRNNVVYDNVRHAVRGYAIDGGAGPRDLTVVNNTLVVSSGNTPIKLTNDLGGHTIFNNVLANEGSSGGSIVVGTASGLRSDHNTFVNPGFSLNGGSTMLTLSQWRAQAGSYDAASRSSTQAELFAAPSSRDYRLRAGAAAANAGAASFNGKSGPAEDIAGVARPQGGAYDHGAYESF